jgi:hypothetical protein
MASKKVNKTESAKFREFAGVLTAFLVVLSYVGIGYATALVQAIFGVSLALPDDWRSAMLSLASAALGYLIGKQLTADVPSAVRHEMNQYTEEDIQEALRMKTVPCPICGNPVDERLAASYAQGSGHNHEAGLMP